MSRRSIDIASFSHANPIPAASRVGPLLASSIIVGREPGSSRIPDDIESQIANLFHHVAEILEAASADWRHIVKMTFYVSDIAARDAINAPWTAHFPDPSSRPARYTQVNPAGSTAVTCEFLAYLEE